MKIEGEWIVFSNGKTEYAHYGVIGLGYGDEGHYLAHGSDGGLWHPGDTHMSAAERVELADYMIAQWQQFKRQAGGN